MHCRCLVSETQEDAAAWHQWAANQKADWSSDRGAQGCREIRITSIMTQAVHGWFQRSDDAPVHSTVWPTVCIFFGSVCCIEEMDDHTGTYSGGPLKGQKYHPALASEWRQLRTSGQLEGIDEDILLWQQPNAWCTAELTCRLYNRFHGWAENRNLVIVQDMAAQQWCPQAKEYAHEIGLFSWA